MLAHLRTRQALALRLEERTEAFWARRRGTRQEGATRQEPTPRRKEIDM